MILKKFLKPEHLFVGVLSLSPISPLETSKLLVRDHQYETLASYAATLVATERLAPPERLRWILVEAAALADSGRITEAAARLLYARQYVQAAFLPAERKHFMAALEIAEHDIRLGEEP